jgi:hypothetical protein
VRSQAGLQLPLILCSSVLMVLRRWGRKQNQLRTCEQQPKNERRTHRKQKGEQLVIKAANKVSARYTRLEQRKRNGSFLGLAQALKLTIWMVPLAQRLASPIIVSFANLSVILKTLWIWGCLCAFRRGVCYACYQCSHYTVSLNELSLVLSTIHDSNLRCNANCFLWFSVRMHLV